MTLNADGTMFATTTGSRFHPINNGTWSVADNTFSAMGADIFGTVVTFRAPRSVTQLDGTWAAGAATGTFTLTKQ